MLVFRAIGVAAAICLAILLPIAGSADSITLAKDGKTDYCIVVADRAIAPERTAARELQSYLKQITGADFPMKAESQVSASDPHILVGQTARARKLAVGVDWKSLGYDGIVIRTVGSTLILSGGQPRGALYAVYSFLEDTIGCRWWSSTESYVPRTSLLEVPELNTVYVPKIRSREGFYRDPIESAEFAVRMKLNGHFHNIPREYGGHYEIIGWCHTAYPMLPPDKYFKDHPEWYSLIDGKRVTTSPMGSQLCFMNEEMQKELARVALRDIRKNPDAGIISISQNDCIGACQCEKCKAVETEDGSPAGPLLRCVNAVAAEIEKQYPNVLVETLAYQHTRKPPLVTRPRKNVMIRLCSIECNFSKPLDSDANASFRDDMHKWSAIAPNLFVWNYVTDFAAYTSPFPNMRALGSDLRFFVKNNTIGVFEQGDAETTTGDFIRMRAWVVSHLMWNPDLDQAKLESEFMRGYYGAAAPYLQRYLGIVHDSAEQRKMHAGFLNCDYGFMSFEVMAEATKLFEKAAKAVASDPVLSTRVRRDRMTLDYVWLIKYDELKAAAKSSGVPFLGPASAKTATLEFIAMGRKWNTKGFASGLPFETWAGGVEAAYYEPPSPGELSRLPAKDIIVIQEDQFQLANPGVWAELVDDPKASDGKAAMLTTDHGQWAVQFRISEEFAKAHPGEWDYVIVARCEGGKNGSAFGYGFFDENAGSGVTRGENLENAGDGEYRSYFVGSRKPTSKTYFWVAPCANPDAVKGVYVDRIVLARRK